MAGAADFLAADARRPPTAEYSLGARSMEGTPLDGIVRRADGIAGWCLAWQRVAAPKAGATPYVTPV
jgi:hypothetical protein